MIIWRTAYTCNSQEGCFQISQISNHLPAKRASARQVLALRRKFTLPCVSFFLARASVFHTSISFNWFGLGVTSVCTNVLSTSTVKTCMLRFTTAFIVLPFNVPGIGAKWRFALSTTVFGFAVTLRLCACDKSELILPTPRKFRMNFLLLTLEMLLKKCFGNMKCGRKLSRGDPMLLRND